MRSCKFLRQIIHLKKLTETVYEVLTETTLKFNYPEKTAWIGGTIGIIGDNSKLMNTIASVLLGLP